MCCVQSFCPTCLARGSAAEITDSRPWVLSAAGIVLAVRATPCAKQSAIEGIWRDADGKTWFAVRVASPPSEGAANEALIRLLSTTLSVKRRDITLTSGAQSRLKRFVINGDPNALAMALETAMGTQ